MKNFKKLFYAFNLFVLFLAILSCAEDAPSTEDVNTDCVADEVAATSTTEKIDDVRQAVIKLYSGGYTRTVTQYLYGSPASYLYTSGDSIFNHDFTVNFDYNIFNRSTLEIIEEGDANFSVQKGDTSEVVFPFYSYSDEEQGINYVHYGHKITNITLDYQSECPELADGDTIGEDEVEEASTSDDNYPLPVLGTLKNKTSTSFLIQENGVIVPEGKTVSSFGLYYSAGDSIGKVSSAGNVDGFELQVTGLKEETKYVVLAYAVMDDSTFYSNDYLVVETDAKEIVQPTVSVGSEITAKTSSSFTLAGNTVEGGMPAPTAFGVAYSLSSDSSAIVQKIASNGSASGYEVEVTELDPETTYYVWAYAIQDGNTLYSPTSTQVTTEAAGSTVTFNGQTYGIDGASWFSISPDQILLSMYQEADGYQDFNINIALNSTDQAGIISGTYTFNGSELSFDSSSDVALTNSNLETTFYNATGGTIILTIESNGDYTVEMDLSTTGGTLTGTYTVPFNY